MFRRSVVLPWLAFALASRATAQTIRGRIVGPDSSPVVGATVVATSLPDSATQRVSSDSTGRFAIALASATGRYSLVVTRQGFALQRRELTRSANGEILVADFRMAAVAQRLSPVKTQAQRPKPARIQQQLDFGPGQSGRLAAVNAVDRGDATIGDSRGDITAALSMIPWLTASTGAGGALSISAFGLGADQNSLMLNGMAVGGQGNLEGDGGGLIPRDGFRLQALPATYDPAVGGFSGVLFSLRFPSGNNDQNRSLRYSLDAPALQVMTPAGAQAGQRYQQHVLSGTASGPITPHHFYNISYQLDTRIQDMSSLLGASPAALAGQGISLDSVARLRSILSTLGIPIRSSPNASFRTGSGSVFARYDYRPEPRSTTEIAEIGFSPADNQVAVNVNGGRRQSNAIGGPLAFADVGSRATTWNAGASVMASSYLFGSILNELSVAAVASGSHSESRLALPGASVLVTSTLPDGTSGFSTLQAAGGGSTPSDQSATSFELKNQTAWYTWDQEHLFTISVDGMIDNYSIQPSGTYGSYTFNSLASFAAGNATSFSRLLTPRQTTGRSLTGAVAFADSYSPWANRPRAPAFDIQYGVRIEGARFGVTAERNPLVDSLFHLRTDGLPTSVTLVPMIGFTKNYGRYIEYPGASPRTRGGIFGGIREYRSTISSRTVDDVVRHDGLSDADDQFSCVGDAIPIPDWARFSQQIPAGCVANASSFLSQARPNVEVFSKGYEPPRSWRGTLGASANFNPSLYGALTGTLALNSHLSSVVDENLIAAPKFVSGIEGRPVFVSPSAIVASTGAMTATDSRAHPEFGSVSQLTSDLRARVTQLSATAITSSFQGMSEGRWTFFWGYAFTQGRTQARGFTNSAAGDPRVVEWVSTASPLHKFTLSGSKNVVTWLSLNVALQASSGTAFTPRVAGDINGDGASNDRAFVFSSTSSGDSVVARGMQSLMSGAPSRVVDCLRGQEGRIAAANSCRGPWSATVNVTLSPDSYRLRLGNRGQISLTALNVLGGLDQLLHGSSNLHGWGPQTFVDPTLLIVRGFDRSSNRFLYSVNPNFGRTSGGRALQVPFRLTLDASISLSPDRETTGLRYYFTGPDHDEHPSADEIRNRLTTHRFTAFDLFGPTESALRPTKAQKDSIEAMKRDYYAYRDSVYTELATYIAGRAGAYGGEEVRQRWHAAIVAEFRWIYAAWPRYRRIFSAEQYAMIPPFQRLYWEVSQAAFESRLRGPLLMAR